MLYGIDQFRAVSGSVIMLLGRAFRENGLPFETTEEALKALQPKLARRPKQIKQAVG